MPYWSSSRVGVVTQPQAPKQKKRSEKFNRQKGITMEDLKKQTAIRLAQEQNRQNQGAPPSPTSVYGGRSGTNPPRGVVHQPRPNTSPVAIPSPQQYHQDESYRPHRDARGDMSPYSIERSSSRGQRSPPPTVPASIPAPAQPRAPDYHHHHKNGISLPEITLTCSGSNQKSKFPHGLTVQELKEMTKARLQAESFTKNQETDPQSHARVPEAQSALPAPQSVERPSSRSSAPSVSPIPPCYNPARESSPWPPQQQDVASSVRTSENWDNQSSLSTAASDLYVSSDFPSALRAPSKSEDSSYPSAFSRSSSFPDGNQGSCTIEPPHSLSNPNISFEANRRRAVTMSPRLGLSYAVHEDREIFDREPLALPSFSHSRTMPNVRTQSAFSAPFQGNRQRASSAASMPSMSHTSDEFGLDSNININNNISASLSRFSSHFGSVCEDIPVTPGLADVFRVSSFDRTPLQCAFVHDNNNSEYTPPPAALENRIRASTWSEPFGRGLMGSCGDISDDLASILKLSGAEDRNN